MFIQDPYLPILLVLMVISMIASGRVQKVFSKYSGIPSSSGIPAEEAAARMLADGNSQVSVISVNGDLTDHYDPAHGVVGLSEEVYGSTSVSALAVAAHEIGHVMQYQDGYFPIRLRNAVLPVASFSSMAAPLIVIAGLFFGSRNLALSGVVLFGTVLLFQLATLPAEFNASSRGLAMLEQGGYLSSDQIPLAKEVLNAAALTYVLATISTFVSFLRLMSIANRSRRD